MVHDEISESAERDLWRHTRAAVAQQPFMELLGITLSGVGDGWVEVLLPIEERVLQHDGLVHGGALATLADIGCALAAHTQMRADQRVVTVELKINYLRAVMPERNRPDENRLDENRLDENRLDENKLDENRLDENRLDENKTEGQDGRTEIETVRCRGEVLRRGRTLTVSEGRLYAPRKGQEVLVAVALATITGLDGPKGE